MREGRDDRFLASYDLMPRERQRIIAIVSQPGMSVHCSLSRGNRLEVVFDAFPMTCVLLGFRLRSVIDELWEQHRPTITNSWEKRAPSQSSSATGSQRESSK